MYLTPSSVRFQNMEHSQEFACAKDIYKYLDHRAMSLSGEIVPKN